MTSLEMLAGGVIKVGDKEPDLRVKLLDEFGYPVNLENASVDMKMKRSDSDTLKIDSSAVIDQNTSDRGIVTYSWKSTDTDTPGTFLIEFIVTFQSGEKETFPADHFGRVYIDEGL